MTENQWPQAPAPASTRKEAAKEPASNVAGQAKGAAQTTDAKDHVQNA